MRVGLFFGSFNPIHNGHLIIAQFVLNQRCVENVWFVVSPQNPFKLNDSLLPVEYRLLLTQEAIKDNEQFKVSDIELNLPVPSYTIDSLNQLHILHPQHEFVLIIGSDNYLSLSKWKSSDIITSNYKIFVYERPGFAVEKQSLSSNVIVGKAPLINISSTEIRSMIKMKKNIRYLVPSTVIDIIQRNSFYH